MRAILSILMLCSGIQMASAQNDGTGNFTVNNTPNSVLTNDKIKPGKEITHFTFKDMKGKLYTTTDLKGKVVVLNFWFASCKPCIEEVDEFDFLVNKYKDSNVVFLSPTFENAEVSKKFMDKYNLTTIVIPNQKEYTKALNLIYYPTNLVLDKDGFIYKSYSGSTPDIDKVLMSDIDFLLRM